MMFNGGSQPDAIVSGSGWPVAQYQNYLFFSINIRHINRETPEHWVGSRRDGGEGVENEFVWDWLALSGREKVVR